MIKKGDDGAIVEDLQRMLIAVGYELPRFGVDGDAGDETLGAFAAFMRNHGAERDINPKLIEDHELEILRRVFEAKSTEISDAPHGFTDRRAFSNRKLDLGPRGADSWDLTRGWMVHQTAANMGENHPRYDGIGSHTSLLRSGMILLHHDLDRYVVHGNGGNAQCWATEVVGTFEGVQGRSETLWRPKKDPGRKPNRPTPEQLESLWWLARWGARRIAAHGGHMRAIFPHRVASGDRDSDPGSEVWLECVKIREALGLIDGGPGFVFPGDNDGAKPIPVEWDSSRTKWRY